MRNMKRALSLALASVMLLGMMVVGTGAASYADVAATDNVEAIEVLKAAEIMIGDTNGNFNPDKAVTRNEAAVMMSNMLGLDAEDYAGTAPFTDVPAWAEAYVSACYANGIVSGTSATTYTGDAAVTAAELGLMTQKALGYFKHASDFGDDWKLAAVKNASDIDLYDGINAGADTAMTRNDAAQLLLNALESKVVYDSVSGSTTNINGSDLSISITPIVKYLDKVDSKGKQYRHIDLRKTGDSDRREDRPKMFYYFYYNQSTGDFYPSYDESCPNGYVQIMPLKDDGSYGRWRVGIDTAIERHDILEPTYMSVKKRWTIMEKDYMSDDLRVKATTAWTYKDVNS